MKSHKAKHSNTLHYVSYIYKWPLLINKIIRLCRHREWYVSESYYPEKHQHTNWNNFWIQESEIAKYGRRNKFFFLYGFDVKNAEERAQYVHYTPFMKRRNFLNYDSNLHNSTCILRNKLYFELFARSIGINTPTTEAYYSNNQLRSVSDNMRETTFEELAEKGNRTLFCKELTGECGHGIFLLYIKDGKFFVDGKELTASDIEKEIHGSEFIFQNLVVQHTRMSELYSNSINTIRLVTVRSLKDGKLHVLPSILRIGANGSFVDNTSQGGIGVGFNLETGQLNEYGFFKPEFGRKVDMHPNSRIKFNDFYIPHIQQAKEKALFFHSMLKDIHSIGWDIAIGQDGPIFIEGNDNWEINGPQVGNRGLRKEFEEYFFE